MFSTGWTSGISSTCKARDFSSICKSSDILPPVFTGVHVDRSLVFYVMFCRSLFVLLSFFFFLVIVLSVLRFTDSNYPFVSSINSLYYFNSVNVLYPL